MRVKAALLLFCFVFASPSVYCQKLSPVFFKRANKFFKKYVARGEVDYLSLQKNPGSVNELSDMISKASLSNNSSRQHKAFYINAYNILLIKNVVDHFPIHFPLEERGFFSIITHSIAGDTLTLNEIESLLFEEHKDVRIVFVLSSASKGSVQLADFAFKPGKLNKQLKKRVKETVNSYSYVRVMDRSSKILLAESFKRTESGYSTNDLVNLLNKFLEKPIPPGFTIDFYPANRKLNSKNGGRMTKSQNTHIH